MGGLAFLDLLTKEGYYTEEKKRQIIVTAVVDKILKVKPTLQQAHRIKTIMKNYYLFKRVAYDIKKNKEFNGRLETELADKLLAEN